MQKIFTVIFLFLSINIFAQNSKLDAEKAKEFYNKALKNITERKTSEAIENLLKAIDKYTTFSDPYFKLGQIIEAARRPRNCYKIFPKCNRH